MHRDMSLSALSSPILELGPFEAFPRNREAEGRGFDLGFRQEYLIHGEQAYEVERPLQVGDVLTGTTTLTDVYQREGSRGGTMTFAVLETEYATRDGEVVMTASSTVIETGGAIDPDGEDDDVDSEDGGAEGGNDDAEGEVGDGGEA